MGRYGCMFYYILSIRSYHNNSTVIFDKLARIVTHSYMWKPPAAKPGRVSPQVL